MPSWAPVILQLLKLEGRQTSLYFHYILYSVKQKEDNVIEAQNSFIFSPQMWDVLRSCHKTVMQLKETFNMLHSSQGITESS